MNCIIIEDEPLARKGIEKFIGEVPFLHLSGACSNAMQAVELLSKRNTDLVFLDIEMPGVTGIDLLKSVKDMPPTIITTAFPDYALVSYELNVLDYLVKPISFPRFLKAVTKAKDYHEWHHTTTAPLTPAEDYFFVKSDGKFEKIFYNDVLFIEAMQNYVIIQLENKKHISYLTMKAMEEYLPPDLFVKINKSYIVAAQKVERITNNEVIIHTHSLPLGRANKEEVLQRIMKDKLIKRK
jgi:DNA-binding LytR/AlgR family response regulator